jgi:putative tricarboxylic transport membrane protein
MRDHLKNKSIQDSIAVFLLGLALGVYSLIRFRSAAIQIRWILSPYLFPLLLSVFAILLSLSLFWEGLGRPGRTREGSEREKPAPRRDGNVLIVVLMSAAYCALISLIRFIPATMLFLAAMTRFLGERRPWVIAAVSVVTPLLLYALFGLCLGVRLP